MASLVSVTKPSRVMRSRVVARAEDDQIADRRHAGDDAPGDVDEERIEGRGGEDDEIGAARQTAPVEGAILVAELVHQVAEALHEQGRQAQQLHLADRSGAGQRATK